MPHPRGKISDPRLKACHLGAQLRDLRHLGTQHGDLRITLAQQFPQNLLFSGDSLVNMPAVTLRAWLSRREAIAVRRGRPRLRAGPR